MNNNTLIYLIAILCSFSIACNSNAEKTEVKQNTNQQVKATESQQKTGVSKAEKGITVVLPDGWKESEMDFQQSYCESMMANLENFNGTKFCQCFLGRIQYYYKPIHAREAYEDQKKWNEECYGLAQE
ncbi:MAG: hypothetical protein ACPG5B_04450 [Chitinophagales bacterium]